MKAYLCQYEDDDEGAEYYFAKTDIEARRDHANNCGCDEISGMTCRRMSWADQYYPTIPTRFLAAEGWHYVCETCDDDLEGAEEEIYCSRPDWDTPYILTDFGHDGLCDTKCFELARQRVLKEIRRKDFAWRCFYRIITNAFLGYSTDIRSFNFDGVSGHASVVIDGVFNLTIDWRSHYYQKRVHAYTIQTPYWINGAQLRASSLRDLISMNPIKRLRASMEAIEAMETTASRPLERETD